MEQTALFNVNKKKPTQVPVVQKKTFPVVNLKTGLETNKIQTEGIMYLRLLMSRAAKANNTGLFLKIVQSEANIKRGLRTPNQAVREAFLQSFA